MSSISIDEISRIKKQFMADKTKFLTQYTNTQKQAVDKGDYKIFLKKHDNGVIFFHAVQTQEEVYLCQQFDGIFFFIDLINSINAQNIILKWVSDYCKHSGKNMYEIPIHIIVLRVENVTPKQLIQDRIHIEGQLKNIVFTHQINFWKNNDPKSIQSLNKYFRIWDQNEKTKTDIKIHCIKQGFYVKWKINGTIQVIKQIWKQSIKPFFFKFKFRKYFSSLQLTPSSTLSQ